MVITLMLLLALLLPITTYGSSVQEVSASKYDQILKQYDIVFLNFYAEWCHFSRSLEPIFDEFATKAKELAGNNSNRLFIGRINYNKNEHLANSLSVTKFPTFKLYRYGLMAKNEYRGPRTVENLTHFIRRELTDPIKIVPAGFSRIFDISSTDRFVLLNTTRSPSDDQSDFMRMFKRSASVLRDDCNFLLHSNPSIMEMNVSGQRFEDEITFWDKQHNKSKRLKIDHLFHDIPFHGDTTDILIKATDHCVPLVRLLTFENAEQMTDEGRQLLVLLHRPEDNQSLDQFEKILSKPQLLKYKSSLNFLHADGILFNHPLTHLGKSINDLPLVMIDSFQHMYVIPDMGFLNDVEKFGNWIEKFLSGALHKELHIQMISRMLGVPFQPHEFHIAFEAPSSVRPVINEEQFKDAEKKTQVPESVFSMLAPSKERYSFARDEL
ncbi:hypothetical protein ACOME3_006515 [Neoechinorhynchus agilis]